MQLPTLSVLAAVVLVLAQGGEPPGAGRRLVIEARDGAQSAISLSELDLDAAGGLGGVRLVPEGFPPWPAIPPTPRDAVLTLARGERLYGTVLGGHGESLSIELPGGVLVPVGVERLREVIFPGRMPEGRPISLRPAAEGDRLYRRTERGELDRDDGAVDSFELAGVRFEGLLGPQLVPWAEVAAIFVEDLGAPEPPTLATGTFVVAELVGGSRLRADLLRVTSRGAALLVHGGVELLVPLETLTEIVLDDGTVAALSARAPDRAEGGRPFGDELGMVWPARLDRCVHGDLPLRAGGRRHPRGIGCLAPSKLAWDLGGEWRALRGAIAVDDSVLRHAPHARGSVVFRILVDGESRFESGVVRGGDAPLAFPDVDLTGARELVLETDDVDGFAGDRADWLGMLLLK